MERHHRSVLITDSEQPQIGTEYAAATRTLGSSLHSELTVPRATARGTLLLPPRVNARR
jgi:hypothetical protein